MRDQNSINEHIQIADMYYFNQSLGGGLSLIFKGLIVTHNFLC